MAAPRVFISSTCYDLSEVRDSLVSFIQGFGFEPVLSDKGDIFYHPDYHTQVSCIHEISNCQLFILIIGGRFGGTYKMDQKKSIVNAEYSSARESEIPVFTFIKREVLEDHRLYQKNKDKKIIKDIEFPAIENQAYSERVFEFINEVKSADVNNGFFPFELSKEIQELLRKQWAGLFFDMLQQRKINEQYKSTNALLTGLTSTSSKLEDLVKSMYRNIAKTEADDAIGLVDKRSMAYGFFHLLVQFLNFSGTFHLRYSDLCKLELVENWFDYLALTGEFTISDKYIDIEGNIASVLINFEEDRFVTIGGKSLDKDTIQLLAKFEQAYDAFKHLGKAQREEILSDYAVDWEDT